MKTIFYKAEINTTETWIIKRQRYCVRSWCGECKREVSLIMIDEAARLACLDADKFYELMELNNFHIQHFIGAKQPLICLNSLCSI